MQSPPIPDGQRGQEGRNGGLVLIPGASRGAQRAREPASPFTASEPRANRSHYRRNYQAGWRRDARPLPELQEEEKPFAAGFIPQATERESPEARGGLRITGAL